MDVSKRVKDFAEKSKNAEALVELTQRSARYVSNKVRDIYTERKRSQETDASGRELTDYLKTVDELKDIDPDKFAITLVKYLFENRR